MNELINKLQTSFQLTDVVEQRKDLTFLTIKKENLPDMISHCRDYEGFTHFVILSVVDWIEDGLFQLTYLLNNPTERYDLGIRVFISRDNATMDSIHGLWRQIATYQREIKEMYGIDFPGSPRVDESFILEGWDEIPPMRREFDTKQYSVDTFFPRDGRESNDPATYMKSKLYPDEEK